MIYMYLCKYVHAHIYIHYLTTRHLRRRKTCQSKQRMFPQLSQKGKKLKRARLRPKSDGRKLTGQAKKQAKLYHWSIFF